MKKDLSPHLIISLIVTLVQHGNFLMKSAAGIFGFILSKICIVLKSHDFFFHKDTIMEFSWPECLSISQYDSVSGEELSPYRRLEAGSIKSFIGGYKPYKVLIHKIFP